MSAVAWFTRTNMPPDRVRLDEWCDIDTAALGSRRRKAEVLQVAIRAYVNGEAISGSLEDNRISWSAFLHAFNRCLALDPTGRQMGWRGLLPYVRVRRATRRKPLIPCGRNGRGGLSGALQVRLRLNPNIRREFDLYLMRNAKRLVGGESRLRPKSAHQKFVDLCRTEGVPENEWPLNTEKLGRGAIRKYIIAFLRARHDDIIATQYGAKAAAKWHSGTGEFSRINAERTLDVVELDEHKCHFLGTIGIASPEGIRWMPLQRVTIIMAADRAYGTVLAYKAIFRVEADADDVLDVLHAMCGGDRSYLWGETMAPAETAGFPSELGAPFTWCAFNQLLVDNALIHLAAPVLGRARDLIGCDVNFGPVGHPERRPMAESIFGVFERNGFQRVPSTTGSHPNDPLRQKPDKAAQATRMTAQRVLELIDDVVRTHNNAIRKRCFGISALTHLQNLVEDVDGFGTIFPQLPPLSAGEPGLHTSLVRVRVCGDLTQGKRAYTHYGDETYVGEALANRDEVSIGDWLTAYVDRLDIRKLHLYTVKGVALGTVSVAGRWRHSPHSLMMRTLINKLVRDGQLKVGYDEDPVHRLMDEMLDESRRSKATKSASVVNRAVEEAIQQKRASSRVAHEFLQGVMAQAQEDETADEEPIEEPLLRLDGLSALNGGDL
ncbi:hypothetical protein JI752_016535 [Lysobacter sp. MMG2]|uniref:hypothetical protein n=1 Tax=Lysobacter sp. MMG2 TaxID=2801338 RepID=UPI001C2114B4|nr:hypothetical protein [Lysobacter sp. MMG2]MBU8977757.1 hypothetical protein [Lysobacter sp. MMG2]